MGSGCAAPSMVDCVPLFRRAVTRWDRPRSRQRPVAPSNSSIHPADVATLPVASYFDRAAVDSVPGSTAGPTDARMLMQPDPHELTLASRNERSAGWSNAAKRPSLLFHVINAPLSPAMSAPPV